MLTGALLHLGVVDLPQRFDDLIMSNNRCLYHPLLLSGLFLYGLSRSRLNSIRAYIGCQSI